MTSQKEYFAFISYKEIDYKWAEWLQHKLEHYRLPIAIRKEHPDLPQRIKPIFEYKSEMAGGELAPAIKKALTESEYLIVICSTETPKSPWVASEVQHFIEAGRIDNIIPFVVDGEAYAKDPLKECFPSPLLKLKEPLRGISINEMGKDAAAIKVVAQMFNLKFDTLWQRFEREKRRKRYLIFFAFILAFLLMAIIALWMYNQKLKTDSALWTMKENQARAVAAKANQLIDEGDLLTAHFIITYLYQDDNMPYLPEVEQALNRIYKKYNDTGYIKFSKLRGESSEISDTYLFYKNDTKILFLKNDRVYEHDLVTGNEIEFENSEKENRVGGNGFIDYCDISLNNDETKLCGTDERKVIIWDTKTYKICKEEDIDIDIFYEKYNGDIFRYIHERIDNSFNNINNSKKNQRITRKEDKFKDKILSYLLDSIGINVNYDIENNFYYKLIDENHLIVHCSDTLYIIDKETNQILQKENASSCIFSHNGEFIISDDQLYCRNLKDNVYNSKEILTSCISALSFSQNNENILVGYDNGNVELRDAKTLELKDTLCFNSPISFLKMANDAIRLIIVCNDANNNYIYTDNIKVHKKQMIKKIKKQSDNINTWLSINNNLSLVSFIDNNNHILNMLKLNSENEIINDSIHLDSNYYELPRFFCNKLYCLKMDNVFFEYDLKSKKTETKMINNHSRLTLGTGQPFFIDYFFINDTCVLVAGEGCHQVFDKNFKYINKIEANYLNGEYEGKNEGCHVDYINIRQNFNVDNSIFSTISRGGTFRLFSISSGKCIKSIDLPVDLESSMIECAISNDNKMVAYYKKQIYSDNNNNGYLVILYIDDFKDLLQKGKEKFKSRTIKEFEKKDYYLE